MQACKARVFSSSSFPQPFRNEYDLVYLLFSVFTWRQQQFKLRNYRFFGVSILSCSIPTLKHLYFTNFTWVCPSVYIGRFERDLNPIRDGLHCWYQMVVCLSRRTRQLQLKSTKGSLSKDDGDVNENSKKAIGLDWQNNNFARTSRFLLLFFAVVARVRREICLI